MSLRNSGFAWRVVVVISLLLWFIRPVHAQQLSKASLEQQKQENLRRIKEAESILFETRSKKEATLGQLAALSAQIEASQDLIGLLNQEVQMLDQEIGELNLVIEALEADLRQLKKEYGKMVVSAYKANRGFTKLTFIFSAPTFNQMLRRIKWIEQYGRARRMQAEQITKVQQALAEQQQAVKNKRADQSELLLQQQSQSEQLISLKQEQDKTIQQLSRQESKIRTDIAQRKKELKQLDEMIAKLVREEIERARREAEAAAKKSKSASAMPLTPEATALGASFEGAQTRLLWPVSSGFISSKFGQHQVYKTVKMENTGVEIQTRENAGVRAVFDGQVRRVFFVPGMNNVVMIQHGDYFTVYARLKEVHVQPLQQVKAKDNIGTVATNTEGVSELHFEIWKREQKLNPEQWLYKN